MKKTGLGSFANIPVLAGINLHTLPGLLYIGVFVTGLGYAFYFMAMETTSAATASLVFYIKPVLAPLMALAILGEPITLTMVIGIAFIIAGSLISLVPGLRRTALKPNHTQ
jgi:drug/metabolite transporter (DMT)-like permease